MVCFTYIQQIYFFQHSFSYFIYLSYFVLKKNEIQGSQNVMLTGDFAVYFHILAG